MKETNKLICKNCNGTGKRYLTYEESVGPCVGFDGTVNCHMCSGSGINMDNFIERCDKIFGGTTWRDKLNEKD
jgi:hypothetical protein